MVIKESKVNLSITKCCSVLGINRSSYYKWLKQSAVISVRRQAECACRLLVHYAYHKHKGTYGKIRIKLYLERIKVKMNHKKIYRLMKNLGLKAIIRKKWCKRKYKKHHVYENKLNRNFTSLEPQTKYVTDVTQLNRIKGQKYYLSPVIDLYNNEIISYSVSKNNDNALVKTMLEGIPHTENKFLIHSDQGSQYTSKMYLPTLKRIHPEIEISMSQVGCCYDNACAESFFSHFKSEFYIFFNPQTEEELRQNIEEFIYYYNHDRIQTKLKTSPVKYRTSLAA